MKCAKPFVLPLQGVECNRNQREGSLSGFIELPTMERKNTGDLLILNATMVLPDQTVLGDLRVENGTISKIAINGGMEPKEDERVIDASGLYLLPGIIDPQVHFREPGQPEKEDLGSGSAAAVSGSMGGRLLLLLPAHPIPPKRLLPSSFSDPPVPD